MEADFIVVGAGSAGCVLADRLSASGRHRVLVVEAGPDIASFWIRVPLGYGKLFYDERVNWCYSARPDAGLDQREDYWPRGRVVGGSSAINAMVYIRGADADFDEWRAATGDPGWGAQSMLGYFRSLEDNDAGPSEWRGRGGPLPCHSITDEAHQIASRFVEACVGLGVPWNPDFNGQRQEGAGLYQINTRNGCRVSGADAFLRPARKRPNIAVLPQTRVVQIAFEGTRCVGVVARRKSGLQTLLARGEVIVAAGAVKSPKLLQLSGIGPPVLLRRNGIDVRRAHPGVGHNLQDHVGLNYYYRSREATLNQQLAPLFSRIWSGLRYLVFRSGPLALSVNQGGAFIRTSPQRAQPNMRLYLQLLTTLEAKARVRPLIAPDPYPAFALGLSNTRPFSRGTIEIEGPDPLVPPAIRPNVYQAPEDLEEMLEAVTFLRRVAESPPLASVVEREVLPGPNCRSRDELVADIRARSGTVFHPCGTCAMGNETSAGVLDGRLQVRGVAGLRVIDASSFPNIVSGNLNVPVMLLAARGADLILEDHR